MVLDRESMKVDAPIVEKLQNDLAGCDFRDKAYLKNRLQSINNSRQFITTNTLRYMGNHKH